MRYLKAIGVLALIAGFIGFILLIFYYIPHLISDKWGWILPASILIVLLIYMIGQTFDD